eukprot:Platyproteum_vivax@DN3594_c0_g1_i1.p1
MFKFQQLLTERTTELAEILGCEQGKTLQDAKGDIFRGLEMVEFATGLSSQLQGSMLNSVATDVDMYSFRQPLGVCSGICPFNFPAMIPLWMFPIAITLGNTFVLKPSERVPLTTMKLMQYLQEIELPEGVVNVVHGGADTVNHLCTDPLVRTVSFVGGNTAGMHVHKLASENGKRTQINMGAKNHAVVLPDADLEDALTMICNGAFGAAGQRCMALSVVVVVGDDSVHAAVVDGLVERAKCLKVGRFDEDCDLGPLITPKAKERTINIVK